MLGSRECVVLVLFSLTLGSGCASVVSGRHAEVEVFSNVPGALVTIRDEKGEPVASTTTPGTVALRRKRGLLRPKGYTATIAAQGYQPEQFTIEQKVNPWVFGNVGFFQLGLVGWVVDNATGAVWQPDDSTYYRELAPVGAVFDGPQLSAQSHNGDIEQASAQLPVSKKSESTKAE